MFHNAKLKQRAYGMNFGFCSARNVGIQTTCEHQREANEVSFSRRKFQLSTVIVSTLRAVE
jgi:hypothetical protein